jgi:FtsH-binding integral membrane protein
MIANLVLVLVLSFGLTRKWLSPSLGGMLFLLYAAVNGVTFSWILLSYSDATVFKAFGTAAILFGVMSVYGFTTKSDLTRFRSLFLMGLIGIIIASVVNIFLQSNLLDFGLSIFGVFLFVGLTAYDTQNIKRMASDPAIQDDGNLMLKLSIFGALKLYLDFINLFLYLLRLFGRSER